MFRSNHDAYSRVRSLPTPRRYQRQARAVHGFTLIELLVVIAIVAILVALLLPALRKARMEGWKAVSLSNVRSLGQAMAAYQHEMKGYYPILTSQQALSANVPSGALQNSHIFNFVTFCTWTGWGKDTSRKWFDIAYGTQDIPAAARPLNQYLTSEAIPDIRVPEFQTSRGKFQFPALKDPSDKIGHQWDWNSPSRSDWTAVAQENFDRTSCYDDVGSSYLWQSKWFFQAVNYIYNSGNGSVGAGGSGNAWGPAHRLGNERFRLAETFQPSRMILVNDEYCDITINRKQADARVINGYGDVNKSIVGFVDGHARYQKIIPGGDSDPNAERRPWLVPAFNNGEYTVVFPYLK